MVRQVLAAPEVLEDLVIPLPLECLAILEVLGNPAAPYRPLALESLVPLDLLLVLAALVGRYRPLALERPEFLEFLAVLEVPEFQEVPSVLGWDRAR
jgi:hypothetical protein